MSDQGTSYTLVDLVGDAVSAEINRRELSQLGPMAADDERRFARSTLRKELRRRNEAALTAGREPMSAEVEEQLIDETLNSVFGFGELERWLQDPNVQDVHINGFDKVFIKTRDGQRKQVSQVAASDTELRRLIADFARRMGRIEQRFDYANPIIDMQLPNGDRLNAMFSVSSRPSMSIRRHNFSISSLDELIDLGVMNGVVARFLRAAVQSRRNLVVSGGTGTGKTTLLRALINEIDAAERIVTVEDNLELGVSRFGEAHPNLVECEARGMNIEGLGGISMADLVVASLRMDPDRIIVGECRGAETVPMLLAMSQGNEGSMTSLHADSSKNVFNRIITYAATLAVPPIDPAHATLLIRDAVHFVVHMGFSNGRRVIQSIREVDATSEETMLSTEVFAPGPDGVATPAFGLSSRAHIDALAAAGLRCSVGSRRSHQLMDVLIMAALGALVGVSLLAVVFTVRGVRLFPGFSSAAVKTQKYSERLVLWVVGAFAGAVIMWALTEWPVGGIWVFVGVMSIPLLRGDGVNASDEIEKVEAIATWTEQIRDTMNASAGLQQSLIATASNGPAPIKDELLVFARRAPRGGLADALRQLGVDLKHPAADLVIAGLVSATELDAGRLVPLLSRLASSIRDEAQMRVRIEISRARIRTSMKIVGFFVGLTMLLMIVAGGELLRGYQSALGQIWLIVVGMVVVVAVWATRKLAHVPQPERFVARRSPA